MKKFKFKLDALLKIRKFEEKQKFMEFSKVLVKYNQNTLEIQNSQRRSAAVLQEESSFMASGRFDLNYSKDVRQYLKQIAVKRAVAMRKNEEMKTEYLQKLQIAQDSRKKRKTLEILKEKKLARYNEELNRAETKMLDDFNQNRQRKEKNDSGKS